MVERFVGLEQSLVIIIDNIGTCCHSECFILMQVAVERVKEFSELDREAAEFIDPRPAATWPSKGGFSRYSLSYL